jgi:hypothetical protein
MREVKKMVITPEIANAMLHKRKPGQKKRFDLRAANALKDKIKRFGYKEGNDNWVVDVDGDLSNGQHRAWVVDELGITVTQHVAFNAPLDEFERTDAHRTRNRAMQLLIAGVPNAKMASPTIMAAIEFAHSRFRGGDANFLRSRMSEAYLVDVYMKSELLQSSVSKMVSSKNRGLLGSLGGFYCAVFSSIDSDLWEDFFGKLMAEKPTTKADIEMQLRERLMETGAKKINPTHAQALIITAWNYRVANRSVRVLAWDKSKTGFPKIQGTTPERFAKLAGIEIVPEYVRVD